MKRLLLFIVLILCFIQISYGALISEYGMKNYTEDQLTCIDTNLTNNGTVTGYTYNEGTVSGATFNSTGGYYGGGYEFDGVNDYINASNSSSLGAKGTTTFSDGITLSAWVYPIGDGSQYAVVGRYNTNYEMSIDQGNDRLYLQARFGNSVVANYGTGGSLALNEWQHIAVTYNNSLITYHKNGVAFDTDTQTGIINITNVGSEWYYLSIGTRPKTTIPFNGSIDEVRVWTEALSTAEIQAEMNSPSPVKTEGLISSWSFNQDTVNATHAFDTNQRVSAPTTRAGISLNTSQRFDGGNDYIDSGDTFNFGTGDFSIFTWIKKNTDNGFIAMKGKQGSGGKRYQFLLSSDSISIGVDDNVHNTEIYDLRNLLDDVWYHVGAIVDRSGNATLYVNGVAGVTGDITATNASIDDSNYDCLIGRRSDSAVGYFNGSIDSVKLLNESLSTARIWGDFYYNDVRDICTTPNSGENWYIPNNEGCVVSDSEVDLADKTFVTENAGTTTLTNMNVTDASSVTVTGTLTLNGGTIQVGG